MKMTLEQFESLVALVHAIADLQVKRQRDAHALPYSREDAERACRDLLCEE